MKKSIIFVSVVILFLSTFKYHLGQIPTVNMYAHHYVYQHFDEHELGLATTSSPLIAKILILFGAEINDATSTRRNRRVPSALFSQIETYNDCFLHRNNRDKETLSECTNNHLKIIEILLVNNAELKGSLFKSRHVPVLKSLLNAGANIEERDRSGMTPLFYQTNYMHKYNSHNRNDLDTGAFDFLISQGADIHVKNKQNQTLLHVAKHSETIASLINKGLDINARDKFEKTPVFYRAEDLNNPKPLKTLVDKGADINIKNNKGITPLESILQSKRYPNALNKNAEYLLKKGAIINDEIYVNSLHIKKPKKLADTSWQEKMMTMYKDINQNDEYSIPTVTHKMKLYEFAIDFDQWKTMAYLINLDFIQKIIKSYDRDISQVQNHVGNSPLHYVVRYSDELTDYFIAKGVNVNSLNERGQPPLFFSEDLSIAKKLIEQGADIYIKDKEKKSALDYIQDPELLNYLLAKGVDAKQKDDNQRTPLINYVQKNSSLWIRTAEDGLKYDKHYDAIKVFLDNRADINERLPGTNETILFLVNDTKLLKQLIADGIDIEARNKLGQTALFKFLKFPMVNMGKTLIENGAKVKVTDLKKNTLLHFVLDDNLARTIIDEGVDINSKNDLGDTPLHELIRKNITFSRDSKYKTFDLFLEKGADINAQNNRGETPLMVSIRHNNVFYINGLLKANADFSKKDNQGNTLLHHAVQGSQSKEFIEFILDKDFDIDINTKNKLGQTMLDYAHYQDLKNYLIEKGAKFGQRRYIK